jgi:hypothetical protein
MAAAASAKTIGNSQTTCVQATGPGPFGCGVGDGMSSGPGMPAGGISGGTGSVFAGIGGTTGTSAGCSGISLIGSLLVGAEKGMPTIVGIPLLSL